MHFGWEDDEAGAPSSLYIILNCTETGRNFGASMVKRVISLDVPIIDTKARLHDQFHLLVVRGAQGSRRNLLIRSIITKTRNVPPRRTVVTLIVRLTLYKRRSAEDLTASPIITMASEVSALTVTVTTQPRGNVTPAPA